MILHGSCAARDADGVLFLGPPGAGKSDLVLRLLGAGWRLVADDQVVLAATADGVRAAAPDALHGLLEVRGLGLFERPAAPAALRLVVHLRPREAVPRLPEPATWDALGPGLPAVALHALDASAPLKIALALDAATGAARQRAGAFA